MNNNYKEPTPHEQRLNYAAWYRKNQNDFLGHIEDKTVNKTIRKARTMKGRTPLTKAEDDALAFPDKHWESFYKDGIGGAKDPRVALRDKLMLLLMHGGGLRVRILIYVNTDSGQYEHPAFPALGSVLF